jgi:imidazolonepropionase-like amidohydrolase
MSRPMQYSARSACSAGSAQVTPGGPPTGMGIRDMGMPGMRGAAMLAAGLIRPALGSATLPSARPPSVVLRSARLLSVVLLFVGLLSLALLPPGLEAQVAVRGGVVHTVSGASIPDGVVVVGADGRISGVGPAATTSIPEGVPVLEAAVVTPGLVDARSVVGLSGILGSELPSDQDHIELSSAIQPELRALDAYNARDPLVEWIRELGTTTLHTGHGPGALISGQTMVVKTRGLSVDEALLEPLAAYAGTLGPEIARGGGGWPGTRARGVTMLRSFLLRGQSALEREDREGEAPAASDLALQEAVRILRGEAPLLITAHQVTEILAALRLQREFGFRLILDGAAEAYLVLDEIRQAGVPVILHPTMARHQGPLQNATFVTAQRLAEAGIPFAIPSGNEPYFPKTRVVLMEGAMAAGFGLPFEDALRAITLEPARILGLEGRVGSLEPGKDGDLVLFDGDPFETTTRVCGVIIEGEVVSQECR